MTGVANFKVKSVITQFTATAYRAYLMPCCDLFADMGIGGTQMSIDAEQAMTNLDNHNLSVTSERASIKYHAGSNGANRCSLCRLKSNTLPVAVSYTHLTLPTSDLV